MKMMKTMRVACLFEAALFVVMAAAISAPAIFTPKLKAQELTAPDIKSNRPTPRTAEGHPDLNGYWKGTREHTVGNIAKDLPGLKLPLTPAGEAAWKHNTTATIDPESLCIIGGIPRHNASGLPFEIIQGSKKVVSFISTATTG